MKTSQDRILVTHCGSLPRSPALTDLLLRQEEEEPVDVAALAHEAASGVRDSVSRQLAAGMDIVSDGEQPRVSFVTYVAQRMRGFAGESSRPTPQDHDDFPEFAKLRAARIPRRARISSAPQAVAEVVYEDLGPLEAECRLFETVLVGLGKTPTDRFMTSASPGIVGIAMPNAYYDSYERYVFAIAQQMRKEYERIAAHGFVLQLDAPDLAMERSRLFKDKPLGEFLALVELHVAAMNAALESIPREQVRLHVCWGNWEGPHVHDVPMSDILPILYEAKVGALSLEFANPRHQHEYEALRTHPLPPEMVLIPGVIDTTTNFVEHPQVVANRICEAVAAVGDRSRVIAGTDCGFSTSAGTLAVASDVVWAKLATGAEGAALASRKLWGRS